MASHHARMATLGLAAAALLGGCATITQAPEPYVSSKQAIGQFGRYLVGDNNQDPIGCFYGPDTDPCRHGLSRKQWREAVIAAHIEVADLRYVEFRRHLNAQTNGANIGLDVAALAVSGWGTVAAENIGHRLAAVGTGLLGVKGAISKDLYYEKTLPAVVAAMDASRSKALVAIRQGQQNDETKYPLDAALVDIRIYENAGSMDAAIGQLTTVATASAQVQQQAAQNAVFTMRSATAQASVVSLNTFIWSHRANRTFLDAVQGKLGLPATPAATNDEEAANIKIFIEGKEADGDIATVASAVQPLMTTVQP